jgi:hypothetical protein
MPRNSALDVIIKQVPIARVYGLFIIPFDDVNHPVLWLRSDVILLEK